jgi:prevent-host-death family protein
MKVTATEFKAKCLALIDRVSNRGDTVIITKRGRVVAKLVAERHAGERPWMALRGQVMRYDDPLLPAVHSDDIEVFK